MNIKRLVNSRFYSQFGKDVNVQFVRLGRKVPYRGGIR